MLAEHLPTKSNFCKEHGFVGTGLCSKIRRYGARDPGEKDTSQSGVPLLRKKQYNIRYIVEVGLRRSLVNMPCDSGHSKLHFAETFFLVDRRSGTVSSIVSSD